MYLYCRVYRDRLRYNSVTLLHEAFVVYSVLLTITACYCAIFYLVSKTLSFTSISTVLAKNFCHGKLPTLLNVLSAVYYNTFCNCHLITYLTNTNTTSRFFVYHLSLLQFRLRIPGLITYTVKQ